MEIRGARYIHVFVPCPLGWGSASKDTIRLARLVKETGLFPVFEAEHGAVTSVSKIRRRVPVTDYLKLQRRYAHLFKDPRRTDVLERLQAIADRNVERFGLLGDEDETEAETATPPGVATDLAGEDVDEPLRPVDTEAESNIMRLLSETHGSPR